MFETGTIYSNFTPIIKSPVIAYRISGPDVLGVLKRLTKRKNFNQELLKKFKKIQYSIKYKKKKSNFIIKNDFTNKTVNEGIKKILKKIV